VAKQGAVRNVYRFIATLFEQITRSDDKSPGFQLGLEEVFHELRFWYFSKVFSSNNDPFYFSSELKVFSSYILLVIS
jgi:hypothetical protein